ncbi:snare Ykt6 [Saitoella complicata NRRL Y-17804]|nr:snare Ykt6 [Saitoella complicata NRRL Y-17804]ODQ50711.1 snare Ykt6 [Saitoella complicata NRRL Y-17804]
MKLYSISILRNESKPATVLASAEDLSSFGFFQRGSVGEFMTFFSKTIAERTTPGQRQDIEEGNNYVGHVYAHSSGLAGVIISDKEYPVRVAYSLLNKILDEFITRHPKPRWQSDPMNPSAPAPSTPFPELHTYIARYQDPKQADTIMRVQQELDETKVVLHKTIESVLERGERLDTLVDRSEALSAQSRMFYKQAKKTNSCCVVM